jgi:hypothetical protein
MRLRRVETQARASASDANSGVDAEDICEVSQCLAPEVPTPGIVGPELGLETLPRDHCWLPEIAHPKSEPGIEIDGEGRSLQVIDGSEIDWDSRARSLLEEVPAQYDV